MDPIEDMLQKQITESTDRKKTKTHIAPVFSHLIILAMAGQESGRRLQTALKPAEGRFFLRQRGKRRGGHN